MQNRTVVNRDRFTTVEGEEGPCSPVWEHLQVELEEDWCLLQVDKASGRHGTRCHGGPARDLREQKQHVTLCTSFPSNHSGDNVNQK